MALVSKPTILNFPDGDTLRLALTSGAVPPAVSLVPATAGFDDAGGLWLQPTVALTRATMAGLARLGVKTVKATTIPLTEEVGCWPQLLPLQRGGEALAQADQTPVLFVLPAEHMAGLVTEILRLGNDRQGYRWLEEEGTTRALLRVVGPPYYSLLRAIDRDGQASAPLAFVERGPRVWVQFGYTHPLAEQIKPPDGKLLLIQPQRQWLYLDDAPFHDIYEVLEFALPHVKAAWREADLDHRLQVPLRLARGGPAESAELWVLRERALEQLDNLVSNADDDLLRRLSFVVAHKDEQTTLVLRVRPSRQAPPVLVLDAVGCRSYLKLPNLFLPCGTRLHPPLRRDAVRKLLADDPAVLTWLYPQADGTFRPESLPDTAFRPLSDWVDYVLDQDRETLQTWVQSTQFDFEPFICTEDQPAKPKQPDKPRSKRPGRLREEEIEAPDIKVVNKSRKTEEEELDEFANLPKVEPSELLVRLRALEEKFLSQEGTLDTPERQSLWPELAVLNARLGNSDDAGVCWMNALWAFDSVPASWTLSWFRTEAGGVSAHPRPGASKRRSWVSQLGPALGGNKEIHGRDLDQLLTLVEPGPADLRALTAYIVWAARQSPPAPTLVERLNPVRHFLEQHEHLLPVRAVWLAWVSLARLTDGDVLALGRARDRLLERLFRDGLRPEQDLPDFLRFSGQAGNERCRAVRQWLFRLGDLAHRWIEKLGGSLTHGAETTKAYADLLFAFGLARVGESRTSRDLLQRAQDVLGHRDETHSFLLEAYTYRVQQALEGKPSRGPLPDAQVEYLQHLRTQYMGKTLGPPYLIDRLRQHSHILEPDQRVEPYRYVAAKASNGEAILAELPDMADRAKLAERGKQLLRQVAGEAKAYVLRKVLDLAPRVGEEFALHLLEQVTAVCDSLPTSRDPIALENQAGLLEKALFVAAHFDRRDHIQALVSRFERLLQSQSGAPSVPALDTLAGQCFRGLRKFGMRDEIDRLLKQMANLILASQGSTSVAGLLDRANSKGANELSWPVALRALLHVAAGWYYFDRAKQAEPVLTAARTTLYQGQLSTREQTKLACTYVETLSQVPVELAQKRLEELFHRLDGVRDTYTTNSHYSLSQLDVIEAVVLAVVSEDFGLGTQVRRWLDDDEFLVRRRIHRDLRALMSQAQT